MITREGLDYNNFIHASILENMNAYALGYTMSYAKGKKCGMSITLPLVDAKDFDTREYECLCARVYYELYCRLSLRQIRFSTREYECLCGQSVV